MNKDVVEVKKPKFDIGQLEDIFIKGDISSMTEVQRVEYVRQLCRSLGLNPMTQPFDYLTFQGKITLYAKKGCTDQLRGVYGISLKIVDQKIEEGVLTVTAQATFPDGRSDEDFGCVNVANLRGDALANAKMKAVTKAKRRVTLSICGLGMLDESELETMPVKREKEVHASPTLVEDPDKKIRYSIYGRLFPLHKEFMQAYPSTDFKELLKAKYKVEETKELSTSQLQALLEYLEKEVTEIREKKTTPGPEDFSEQEEPSMITAMEDPEPPQEVKKIVITPKYTQTSQIAPKEGLKEWNDTFKRLTENQRLKEEAEKDPRLVK